MTAVTPLIRAAGVSVRLGRRTVLRDVGLDVPDGEVVAVLGPNGAGKSTLLRALAGQVPLHTGEVERHGRTTLAMQAPHLARRSVLTNVELALAWWGVPRAERRSRATAALADVHAGHLASRLATQLSGGEQRRVHLARFVAVRPDVLLLDEPFAGVDDATRAALLDETAHLIRDSARAVVVVVHDRTEAFALADRLVVILDGRVAADGAPHRVLAAPPSPAVARFLGYTGELAMGDELVLVRPSRVRLATATEPGDLAATVTRLTPLEDGTRVHLAADAGHLSAVVPSDGLAVGDRVSVHLDHAVRFPAPR